MLDTGELIYSPSRIYIKSIFDYYKEQINDLNCSKELESLKSTFNDCSIYRDNITTYIYNNAIYYNSVIKNI